MFRTFDAVMIAIMVSAAAFTYKTKHDAERRYEELRRIQAEIRHELDTIDVLRADWSLLTQPARLQRLAAIYRSELDLHPVETHQIVDFSELPDFPIDLENSPPPGAVARTDGLTTGGTAR